MQTLWEFGDIFSGAIYSLEGQLIANLLRDSSKFARPMKNASHKLILQFGLELIQVQEVVRDFVDFELSPRRVCVQ